jgi:retinol dehydrogenase-14
MDQFQSRPMAAKTVLVTGASGGIGKATALGLARMGAHLAICGRDRESTEDAAGEIGAAGGGQTEMFVADLSDQAQVRRLADQVLQRLPRIDVLVNNAGGYWNTRHVTADGLERTFALNHLAPFLLTNLLWDRLRSSAPARVITVSSNAHAQGRIDFDDLQGGETYSGAQAYSQSKLANVLFTYELARRLPATSVTANALHPGLTRTGFGAEDPAGIQRRLVPLLRPFMQTPPRVPPPPSISLRLPSWPGHGTVFHRPRAQAILQGQLRPSHRCPALAGQRRAGRPDHHWLNPPRDTRNSPTSRDGGLVTGPATSATASPTNGT